MDRADNEAKAAQQRVAPDEQRGHTSRRSRVNAVFDELSRVQPWQDSSIIEMD
jgi:hypothetical protein